MIRYSSTHYHRKEIYPPDLSSISSYRATIKSNIIDGSNRSEHQKMIFHPSHIHFNIGRYPCAFQRENDTKRLGLISFYGKRDEVGVLSSRHSTTHFHDRTCNNVRKVVSIKKEHAEGLRYCDDPRRSFQNNPSRIKENQEDIQIPLSIVKKEQRTEPKFSLNDEPRTSLPTDNKGGRGFIFECDRDDHMIFPWKELEKDLAILTNQNRDTAISCTSPNPNRLESASVFPTPTRSTLSVDPTIRPFPWLETQTLAESSNAEFSTAGSSTRKDVGKNIQRTKLEDNIAGNMSFVDRNGRVGDRYLSKPVEAPKRADPKHKAAASRTTRHKHWSKEEDEILRSAMVAETTINPNWEEISSKYFNSNRSAMQCKNRWKNHAKPGIIRGQWDPSEDESILRMKSQKISWKEIASHLPGRSGESIRERYVNHLDPSLKKSKWTEEEDEILFQNQRKMGNKWSEIRKFLPGRSDNSIKNRYHNRKNSFLRRLQKYKNEKAKINSKSTVVKVKSEAGVDTSNLNARSSSLSFEDFPEAVVEI